MTRPATIHQNEPRTPPDETAPLGESTRYWSQVVRGAYLDLPGLSLTRKQVQRLWGLDIMLSDTILKTLADERFLRRRDDGVWVSNH